MYIATLFIHKDKKRDSISHIYINHQVRNFNVNAIQIIICLIINLHTYIQNNKTSFDAMYVK